MDRTLENLKTRIYTEIDETLSRGKVEPTAWEMIGEVVDCLKDLAEIEEKEMGYSGSYMRPVYARSYDNQPSRYTNGNSYHGGKDYMISELNRMMNEASTERERTIIYDCIGQLKMA